MPRREKKPSTESPRARILRPRSDPKIRIGMNRVERPKAWGSPARVTPPQSWYDHRGGVLSTTQERRSTSAAERKWSQSKLLLTKRNAKSATKAAKTRRLVSRKTR